MHRTWSWLIVAHSLILCGCGRGEIFVTRQAELAVTVVTSDRRQDVPCHVTHLSFGEEQHEGASAGESGRQFVHMVEFTTQLNPARAFRPTVALMARCEGYGPAATAEKEIDVGWLTAPKTDFGTLVVEAQPSPAVPSPRTKERAGQQ